MVDLARKNLVYDKLRFLITISGVAFAVTLVGLFRVEVAIGPAPEGRLRGAPDGGSAHPAARLRR